MSDRERQILYDITYMRTLKKNQTSEYNKKEKNSQIQKTYQWGKRAGEEPDTGRGLRVQTTMYKINKLQRYCTAQEI